MYLATYNFKRVRERETQATNMDDAFVSAFFAIDYDKKGEISEKQLIEYQLENNYEDSFVAKWLNLFDRQKTGRIQLAEFCDVLGLEYAEVKKKQEAFVPTGKLPSDVFVITEDMELKMELRIIQITRDGLAKNDKLKDVAKYIKQTCDKEFHQLWHVVIVRGQYWSYYSYDPRHNFVFKLGGNIFIIYKTPLPY